MNLSIERFRSTTDLDHEKLATLAELTEDFRKRADPDGRDGWQASDIMRIMGNCMWTDVDATWLVFADEKLVGFQILCFGPSMHGGRMEAQIVAFYLRPDVRSFTVAPEMVATMRRYASERGAFRIIAGTQRHVERAFKRLGAYRVGDLYAIDLQGAA
jgi:GNAT superfamily N-acetyltransferase